MKTKIFYILLFSFLFILFPFITYGNENTNTKEYCKKLIISADKEAVDKNYVKALEMLNEAMTIAKRNDFFDIQIGALNSMGVLYKKILDYDKAMAYYLEAYEIALKIDYKEGQLILLANISNIYAKNKSLAKAKEYAEIGYKLANEINDSIRIAQLALNLINRANEIKDFESAEKYINIITNILRNDTSQKELIFAQVLKTETLYLQGKYDMAESLGLTTFSELKRMDQGKKMWNNYKPSVLLLLSKIYQKKGNIAKAIAYASEVLNNDPTIDELIETYEQLADLYQENNALNLSIQYKDSVIMAKDSLHNMNNKDYLESNRIKLELLNSEKELTENKAKQKAERILFISILAFIIVLLLVFIWTFSIRSIRNKQRQIIAENKQKIIELELDKERNEKLLLSQQLKEQETSSLLEKQRIQNEVNEKLLLKQQLKEKEIVQLLEKERLKNEIEVKNKQLMAKALSQFNRDSSIREVITILSDVSQKSEDPMLDLSIRKLNLQLKNSTEWDNFLTQFEQINPALFFSLKKDYPDLTENDIHLLSYIYLDLSAQKIAYLLNISIEAYRKKKQRLASKMGLEVSKLHLYLVNKV